MTKHALQTSRSTRAKVHGSTKHELGSTALANSVPVAVVEQQQARPSVPSTTSAGVELPGGTIVTQVPGGQPRIGGDPNGLRRLGGSGYPKFNQVLLNETVKTLSMPASDADAMDRVVATAAALSAFKPIDEIEGMIAAQAVAMHFTAMECLRRSMIAGQDPDLASKLRKDGANLSRAMTDMLEAIDRKRGKGPQVVRVERVVVHEGGQAIVGNVHPAAASRAGG